MGAERKERPPQVACCKAREKTGELELESGKESKKLHCSLIGMASEFPGSNDSI